ncbi:ribonuclease HI family protein [candidate division WOR-3 bacterium]|nr:ribonuclease HI family protein [candidate division WOR-3 bacterium]
MFINVDGSSLGNPGPAGIGVVVTSADGRVLRETSRFIGRRTNNQAEYEALVLALEQAREWPNTDVVVRTDSELVFRQLDGAYKVKNQLLRPLYERARELLAGLPSVRLCHVPREENRRADKLAKDAAESGRES